MPCRDLAVSLALLLLGGASAAAERCLDAAAAVERATPTRLSYAPRARHGAIDARGVLWRGVRGHALKLGGSHEACLSGGRLAGPYPENAVYECAPEHCPDGTCPEPCWPYHVSAGVSVRVSAPTVIEDVRVSDYGDAISQERSAERAELEVRRAHLHDIHDDAIENDWGASVRVTDSLLERVNVAFASRQRRSADIDARDRVFEVRRNLVRLHRFTNQYKQRSGHGGFWKWGNAGKAPRLIVTDNVFLADRRSIGLLFPLVDQLVECRNNRLLWAGTIEAWEAGLDRNRGSDGLDERRRLEALSHCYTVILKPIDQHKADFLAQHWDPLVREWKATHGRADGRETP